MAWPPGWTPCRRVGRGEGDRAASVRNRWLGHFGLLDACRGAAVAAMVASNEAQTLGSPACACVPHRPAPPHPLPQALLEGATADLSHLAGEVEEGFAGLELGMTAVEHRIKGEPSGLAAQQKCWRILDGMWLLLSKNG